MGNTPSSTSKKSAESEFENFYEVIDHIATFYILTMDFKSLSKLSEQEYCDKLIILTADIIDKYFSEKEIPYLEQRLKHNEDGTKVIVNSLTKEKFAFIDKDKLDELEIANDTKAGIQKNVKKRRVCIGLAKFYVKIAHVFAAIVMTINPVYRYKDTATGQMVQTSLLEKDKIPSGTSKEILKLNICDNRIRALRGEEEIDEVNGTATIQPEVCEIPITMDKNLNDEPGIPELMHLYEDKYDYNTGAFTGMSDESKAQFQKDLEEFYKVFTGNSTMPAEITKFSDIKLRDYSKTSECMGLEPKLNGRYRINQKDELFVKYADNLKGMIQSAADNQSKLLDIINRLFTYDDGISGSKKKVIRINPDLTEESLQSIVIETRKLIMALYNKCEQDYNDGVKLYQAIVESKHAELLPRQIVSLESESDVQVRDIIPAVVVAHGVNPIGSDFKPPVNAGPEQIETGQIPPVNALPAPSQIEIGQIPPVNALPVTGQIETGIIPPVTGQIETGQIETGLMSPITAGPAPGQIPPVNAGPGVEQIETGLIPPINAGPINAGPINAGPIGSNFKPPIDNADINPIEVERQLNTTRRPLIAGRKIRKTRKNKKGKSKGRK